MWEYLERNIALYHGVIREQKVRCPVREACARWPLGSSSDHPCDWMQRVCWSWEEAEGGEARREGGREVEMERKGGKPGALIMMCPQA